MPRYLADTSAWHHSGAAPVAERWATLVELDEIALCEPVELELLYSARGASDYRARRDELAGLPRLTLDGAAAAAALSVQQALASRGQHRGPTPTDLLIAAIAQRAGATLLHYDRHYDGIARVTGQPTEWVARRGSLD